MYSKQFIASKFKYERRGYYSEKATLSDKDKDTDKDVPQKEYISPMHAWKPHLEGNSPILHALNTPLLPTVLEPAIRYFKYGSKFPICFPLRTIAPKVQLREKAPPGQIPREVEVERRRRKYAELNIQDTLEADGIEMGQLVPVQTMGKILKICEFKQDYSDSLKDEFSSFPLEWFDDWEYDYMVPRDWLNLGSVENKCYPIPAEAFLPNEMIIKKLKGTFSYPQNLSFFSFRSVDILILKQNENEIDLRKTLNNVYKWTKVVVSDFDPLTALWTIIDMVTRKRYKLHRIYIRFIAEDPIVFTKRISSALKWRKKCEINLKFDLIVDNMILTGVPFPPSEHLNRLFQWSLNLSSSKDNRLKKYNILENHYKVYYQKILCEMELKHNIKNNQHEYSFIHIPESTEYIYRKKFSTGIKGFKKYIQRLQFIIIFSVPETVYAYLKVMRECHIVQEMNLFQVYSTGRFTTLDDFHMNQINARTIVINYLKDIWIENITANIRLIILSIGGWFDLSVADWNVYNLMKMYRFAAVVLQTMQYTLRYLVVESTKQYCKILCDPCECLLNVPINYEWPQNLVDSPFQPNGYHIFNLTIYLNMECAYYSSEPNDFLPAIRMYFDEAILASHTIKHVDPLVLSGLVFDCDIRLSSMGLLDPLMIERKKFLELCYEKAIIPLKAYAKRFEIHLDLYNLDVKKYILEVKESNYKSSEVKDIVNMHLSMKAALETGLPESIYIGPFLIDTLPMKELLIKKRMDLADKVLNYFTERMRDQILAINEDFHHINKRLNEKPATIEKIFETREWIETIPEDVYLLEERTRTKLFEYEILDAFFYAIPNEDFTQKWHAIAWPFIISKQIEATKDMFEGESEKLYQQQVTDLAEFDEVFETLSQQVLATTQCYDSNKATETAIDIKKTWAAITDAIARGKLINKRQELFEQPLVDISEIEELLASFSPYRLLWTTAADFIKSKEAWCGNPLTNIEPTNIRESLNGYNSNMNEVEKVFKSTPKMNIVVSDVMQQLLAFEDVYNLIVKLKNPAFFVQHWQELSKRAEIEIKYSLVLSIGYCLDKGILSHYNLVQELSDRASIELEEFKAREAEEERRRIEEALALEFRKKNRRGRKLV